MLSASGVDLTTAEAVAAQHPPGDRVVESVVHGFRIT